MAEKDYSHRDVVDKLGIKPGYTVAWDTAEGQLDEPLRERILARAGRPLARDDELVDVVLIALAEGSDAVEILTLWRPRLRPSGGIWLLTPKRGRPGYLDQRSLIAAGQLAGLVDNKVCSISDTTSAMRFVIRRSDRLSAS